MSLIPNFFRRDDDTNTKKGIIEPDQLSALISKTTSRKTGILDIFTNPCGSDVLTNIGSNGKATITLKKGYISICGRLITITDNTQVEVDLPSSGTMSGSFGVKVDLSNRGDDEVTFFIKETTLQTEDLTENPTSAVYEFRIYDFTATTSQLVLSNKTTEIIEDFTDYLSGANFITQPKTDSSKKIATTEFVKNVLGYANYYGGSNFISGTVHLNRYYVFDFLGKRFVYGTVVAQSGDFTGSITIPFNENVFTNTDARYLSAIGNFNQLSATANSITVLVKHTVSQNEALGYLIIESKSNE